MQEGMSKHAGKSLADIELSGIEWLICHDKGMKLLLNNWMSQFYKLKAGLAERITQ